MFAVMFGIGMIVLIAFAFTDGTTHEQIDARLTHLEDQMEYVSCLLLIPPEQRIPSAVAQCQVNS